MPPDCLPSLDFTRIGVCWWRHRIPGLETLLEAELAYLPLTGRVIEAVAGWGRKASFDKARRIAHRRGLPLLTLEDGFLRSVELGKKSPPWSVIVDDLGVYYDAGAPSRLEALIAAPRSPAEDERARRLIALWRTARVSKYNQARDYDSELPPRYVLVADQTLGDAAIRCGQAGPGSFQRMLSAALAQYPDCTVLLKVHPDVLHGYKRGHFDVAAVARNPRVQVLGEDCHPVSLIERAEAVFVVTSQLGFEALLWGKPVHTFGMPFYAGWGLTRDELAPPARRRTATLEQLVYAALIAYPRYLDPETGQRCGVERLVEWLGLQRRIRQRLRPGER